MRPPPACQSVGQLSKICCHLLFSPVICSESDNLSDYRYKKSKWVQAMLSNAEDHVDSFSRQDENSSNTHKSTVLPGQLLTKETKETETQGILKNRGTFENQRSKPRKIVFADDTVGGSESEMTTSSDSEAETEIEMSGQTIVPANKQADEFSTHVVGHFVKRVIRMKSQDGNEPDLDESDSDEEFLQSLNVLHKSAEMDSYVPVSIDGEITADLVNDSEDENSVSDNNNTVSDDMVMKSNSSVKDTVDLKNGDSRSQIKGQDPQQKDDGALLDVAFLGKLVRTQVNVLVKQLYINHILNLFAVIKEP